MKKMKKFITSKYALLAAGLVIGALVILVIRFATYKPDRTHYHANFAVYINGQREQFKGPTYYEETVACSAEEKITPAERAHMHNDINDVIHVHDHAVTWEQFFNNIGWSIGPDFISTRGALYQNSGDSKLHIILNGQDLTGIAITNRTIGDLDKLLVSYGTDSASQLQQEYNAVPSTAKNYDKGTDPKSCAGTTAPTFHDRLTHLF